MALSNLARWSAQIVARLFFGPVEQSCCFIVKGIGLHIPLLVYISFDCSVAHLYEDLLPLNLGGKTQQNQMDDPHPRLMRCVLFSTGQVPYTVSLDMCSPTLETGVVHDDTSWVVFEKRPHHQSLPVPWLIPAELNCDSRSQQQWNSWKKNNSDPSCLS